MNAAGRGVFSAPTPCSLSRRRRQPPCRLLPLRASASFSTPDAELESRGFRLRRAPEGLDLEALNAMFARVGFPRRDPARIRRALEHTQSLVWVEDGRSERPVAFGRAAGDGVFNAVVWDVVVDPSFQGMGLGTAVMERLVDDLRRRGVCNIALYAEPKVIGFYRPLGFAADPDGVRGMVYAPRRQRQPGDGGGGGGRPNNFLM